MNNLPRGKKCKIVITILNHTKWVLQKVPSQFLWRERWPLWGYAGVESARSSFSIMLIILCMKAFDPYFEIIPLSFVMQILKECLI